MRFKGPAEAVFKVIFKEEGPEAGFATVLFKPIGPFRGVVRNSFTQPVPLPTASALLLV